jgi:hypothetical protein
MKLRCAALVAVLALLIAYGSRAERIPPMTGGPPGPGRRVKQTPPEYRGTKVFHTLYLPTNWRRGRLHPVIVEYAGTFYGVEKCRLGFYQSGGRDFIWVVMPWVSHDRKKHPAAGWGNRKATVDYCKTNLKRICETYGGDTSAVFVTGFSRGAWACNVVALADEEIADVWLGFLPHSGYHVSALGPMSRVKGRATFISYGDADILKGESLTGRALLKAKRFPVASVEVPRTAHTDEWITRDCPARRTMRRWIRQVLRTRPGTREVRGKVSTVDGKPLAGVRVQSGGMHWTFTDRRGEYVLRGLTTGKRTLSASGGGYVFRPTEMKIVIAGEHLTKKDFVGRRLGR